MSERVERKILTLLDEVQVSPYGNPVPGLDELGITATGNGERMTSMADHPGATRFVVLRVGEPLQSDNDLLERMSSAGIEPGATVSITRADDRIDLAGPSGAVTIDGGQSGYLFGSPA